MTGGFFAGLGSILGLGIKSYEAAQEQKTMDAGINYQKAAGDEQAIKNVEDHNTISSNVDNMSDDELRNSPYANRRD